MAKLADARDSKSREAQTSCGFDPHLRHQRCKGLGESGNFGSVGANPMAVLVPCHRVVGADGSLNGFAWGLDLKRRLLAHERSAVIDLFV